MNVKPDTSKELTQPDAKVGRKTRIKMKNPRHAANAASLKKKENTPQADSEQQAGNDTTGDDPRKALELNADDFFKLGRYRI